MAHRELLIAAGGTGGHIIPGILIGRQIEETCGESLSVRYLCGSRPIEEKIYTSESIKPIRLTVGSRFMGSSPIVHTLRMGWDFLVILGRLLRRRPAAILAMGGAVCFPALVAAVLLRIPIFLHESNRIPGRVVRMFRRFARKVFLGMDGLEGKNVVYTGTPARLPGDAEENRDLLLCVGGSQGAARLNDIFIEAANSDSVQEHGLKPILISGTGKGPGAPGIVEVREYEPNLPDLLSRARLVVSRSGSGALADIATHRAPSILVPYPYAKDNHQLANATWFTQRGAARLIEEKSLSAPLLIDSISDLLSNPDELGNMTLSLSRLSTPMAAELICKEIINSIDRRASLPRTEERRVQHEHP